MPTRKIRQDRQSKGLCGCCGRPNKGKAKRCNICTNKDKKRREFRKIKGRCTICGGEKFGVRGGCQKCSSRAYNRAKASYQGGKCKDCEKPTKLNKVRCAKCLTLRRNYKNSKYYDFKESKRCVRCGTALRNVATSCNTCLEKDKIWRRTIKIKVLDHYGRKCKCCGETQLLFMTIDHINNDGAVDRKKGLSGYRLYKWIITKNFPTTFQLLCSNCNLGKSLNNGVCPHSQSL